MQLEVGKRYIRRDDIVTGPLEIRETSSPYPFVDNLNDETYMADGSYWDNEEDNHKDIIAPYTGQDLSLPELVGLIMQWGTDRGIIENSTPQGQCRKSGEEFVEMMEAASELKAIRTIALEGVLLDDRKSIDAVKVIRQDIEARLKDAIGDVFVTLCMVAGCAGLDITYCVAAAYYEIKDRKGYLRADGVFVKEGK